MMETFLLIPQIEEEVVYQVEPPNNKRQAKFQRMETVKNKNKIKCNPSLTRVSLFGNSFVRTTEGVDIAKKHRKRALNSSPLTESIRHHPRDIANGF